MQDLTELLNKGHEPVKIVTVVNPFKVRKGPIPYVVPVLREMGRTFAGGSVVLKERLDALVSGDEERIEGWGNYYYDLADACIAYNKRVKFQPDSPLLKGIRGVVKRDEDLYVAIDARAVEAATYSMKHFRVTDSAMATYGVGNNQQSETAHNIVLLKYASPSCIELSSDQFNAVNAEPIQRGKMISDRNMSKEEIVKDGQVLHQGWAIYSDEIVVPLVERTFKYSEQKYGYDTAMGIYLDTAVRTYLLNEPANRAELRALCVSGLFSRAALSGNNSIGVGDHRLVGVAEKGAPIK